MGEVLGFAAFVLLALLFGRFMRCDWPFTGRKMPWERKQ